MAASQYPKRVLWICDAVIDMTAWVYYRLKKHVHSCSLTTKSVLAIMHLMSLIIHAKLFIGRISKHDDFQSELDLIN